MSFIRKIKRNGRIYLAEVETKRVDGKVKQKFIRYLGVEPNAKKSIFPSSHSDFKMDGVKVYGSVIVLDFLSRQLGLYDLLGEHAYAIMTLVFCHCHDYRSVLDVERWFKKTDLDQIFGVPEITEKQLRNALNALENLDHLQLQKSIFEMASRLCNEKSSSVIYDVTNIYFEGTHCNLAKYGKDKENVKGRRLVQIGLGITKERGLPIFHQVHPGNVHDSKIFKEAITLLRRYGIRNGTIIHDRGITSKSSVLKLSELRWKVIAGVPLHRGIKNAISEVDLSNIETFGNLIQQGKTPFYATSLNYTLGDTQGKLLILLNPFQKQEQRQFRMRSILEAQQTLKGKKEIDSWLKKFFSKSGKINTHSIRRKEKYDGISILFTNGKFSREEMIRLYFEKDTIEKSFQSLKGVLGLRPVRFWLQDKVNAPILICYLSYTLLTTFKFFLYKNKGKEYFSNLSVTQALEELNNIYRIYFKKNINDKNKKNKLSQLVTMTSLQEKIISAFSPNLIL